MQKGFAPILILVCVLMVGIVVAGGGYYWQKSQALQLEPTTPPILTPTKQPVNLPQVDETANWKTYSNTKYNFEVKYPEDVIFYSTEDGKSPSSNGFIPLCDETNGISCFLIATTQYPGTNFEGAALSVNIARDPITQKEADTEQKCLNLVSQKGDGIGKIRINGTDFSKREFRDGATGHTQTGFAYSTFLNQHCFELTTAVDTYREEPPIKVFSKKNKEETERILGQMLSTFKFTDNNDQLNKIIPVLEEKLTLWIKYKKEINPDFNLGLFQKHEETQIKPLLINTYLENSTTEQKLRKQYLYVYSPDRTKAIDPFTGMMLYEEYGNIKIGFDVDSDVNLIDFKNKQEKRLLQCGASCGFDDAVWIDNNIFAVVGKHAAIEDLGIKASCPKPYTCSTSTLNIYDLTNNKVVTYYGPVEQPNSNPLTVSSYFERRFPNLIFN